MNIALEMLKRKRNESAKAAKDFMASIPADAEMTAEQVAKLDGFKAEFEKLDARIKAEEAIAAMSISEEPAPRIEVHNLRDDDPKAGWKHYGEFARAVQLAQIGKGFDERLMAGAPTTTSSEGIGTDGGFLVPPEFASSVWSLALDEDSLLALTDNTPVSGNTMIFPKDESTPYGSTAVSMYWEGEAQATTQAKITGIKQDEYRLRKLQGVIPVSDELLSDAPAMSAFLTKKTATAVRYKTNDAIMNGSGVGQPKGFTNSGAIVTQAKETGQAAATINANNIAKMAGRLLGGSLGRAVWLIHPDAFNQLITMTIGNQPVWTSPNSGIKDAPYGLLLGRPIITTQLCATLGTVGDIYLVDLSYYRTITKAGGVETATSMHLFFDAGATAFRITFRMDGGSALSSTVAAKNGSSTMGPFVSLATRA